MYMNMYITSIPPTNPVVFSDLPCRVAWMLSSEFPPCLWGPGCWYSPTAWWGEEIKPAKKKTIVNQNRHVNQYMCSTYLWIQACTSSMYLHACILFWYDKIILNVNVNGSGNHIGLVQNKICPDACTLYAYAFIIRIY